MADDASTQAIGGGARVSVLLPLPLAGPYDYLVPEEMTLQRGEFVIVPLGPRELLGVVWGKGTDDVAEARLKPVVEHLEDAPSLPEAVLRFVDWVAAYTLSPPGAVLRMAMSVPSALVPPRLATGYRFSRMPEPGERVTAQRKRVIELLAEGVAWLPPDLAREAGVGAGVLKAMEKDGIIEKVELPPGPPFEMPDVDRPGRTLSTDQAAASTEMCQRLAEDAFSVTLLDGVTGSGKTEVYFEAVAECLRRDRQALVLLPEIALSAEWLGRFESRFGVKPAVWHSDLTQAERRITWRAIAEGKAPVVVGARSALFLPYPDLGLIVVDEEHDPAFKQEDGVHYHARDMAVVRAQLGRFPIVLSSATPSLESHVNETTGRYRRLHLPDRHAGAQLPDIRTIDLRRDKPPSQHFLSPPLVQALHETLAAGEQSLLFLNRRGYAPLTLCRACGTRLACPNCSTWLVEHRLAGRLQCHHCGHSSRRPPACSSCGADDAFAACGPGVERLAEELLTVLPEARFTVMTSDTIGGPAQAAELVRSIRDGEVDVVIGTQMVAKGHNFPKLTLVGVVDADLGLEGGDLRAAERTYQLLHQVAGRAGRHERPGRVLLQTWQPESRVMAALASGDRDRFLAVEAAEREAAGMPPYGRLVGLVISSHDPQVVDAVARALGKSAPTGEGIQVLGPAPAPLALLRGRHRRRLLLKADRAVRVQPIVVDWLARVKVPGTARVQIDIDPYSFL
ncbi:MAG: primosomal protein N' [Alphaproteobacteria bacterium]|nr:primosomal protein N' [Alphaproteobacteria bacterium]